MELGREILGGVITIAPKLVEYEIRKMDYKNHSQYVKLFFLRIQKLFFSVSIENQSEQIF